MFLLNEDPKILFTCKSILYLYIENNSFPDYSPFLNSIAIIKFSRNINKIYYQENSYEIYFKDNDVNNIYINIQNEFKDLIEEEVNLDFRILASTVDNKKYKRISLSNEKNFNISLFNDEKKYNNYEKTVTNTEDINKKLNKNTFNSERKRNVSMNNSLKKEISNQYSIINKRLNQYNINRINIDLGQISRLPFERLAKLSIRYMKK